MKDKGLRVTIIEKRTANTRSRPVKLSGRILDGDCGDDKHFFSEDQLKERSDAIKSIKEDLFYKIVEWSDMSTPIQTIQDELTKYFQSSNGISPGFGVIHNGKDFDVAEMDLLMNFPNKIVIDCTGYHSVLRDQIQADNRFTELLEYAIVWTFEIPARYECDELCKYFKNRNTQNYQIIPSVNDTCVDKANTHVLCQITIGKNIFDQLSQVKPLTHDYLKGNFPEISNDMDRFLENLSRDLSHGLPINSMEMIVLPLHVYKARKMTHIATDGEIKQPRILLGDSAMGGPYFQSISMGWEAAIYFAHIFKHTDEGVGQMLKKYEDYMERLWLKLLFRSREINRNKELFKALFTDDLVDALRNIEIL